ncbi:PREDICTED: uncharacterized protein LOC109150046 [Ipomoea nil]|uniref:uncharacterized protein LOC109150046 n=1 Tax=Ipomoea nil TaxID=35883 RepID=UPI000901F9C4|nr:PREDICTED: uncharacterized protein LOC109150046 [Ipomoea nil]
MGDYSTFLDDYGTVLLAILEGLFLEVLLLVSMFSSPIIQHAELLTIDELCHFHHELIYLNTVSGRRSYADVVMTENQNGNSVGAFSSQSPAQMNMNSSPNHAQRAADEFDDPWYLHITENPNLILVSPPLSEVNYASWSRSMKIALEVKNKFGFADGSILKPEINDPKYTIWKRCNNIVCYWIFKSLSPTIAEGVLYLEVASDVWNTLKKRYSQVDSHRIAELQNEIFKCSQGLNEEYENIKSGILVMEPIPAMEKVLNITLKMERKLRNSLSQKNNDLVQANVVQGGGDQSADDQPVVSALSNNNKKKYNSWVAGYKSKNKQQPQDAQQVHNASVNQIGDIGLTNDQFQRLLSLLQNQNQGSQASTNATVTVNTTGLRPEFRNPMEKHHEGKFISNLHGMSVKLPNGEMLSVSHIGQVKLHKKILLQDVLHIPSFTFNIISASKLVRQSGYEIIMKPNSCTIQGHLGRMDGFAKERDGLYILSDPPMKRQMCGANEESDILSKIKAVRTDNGTRALKFQSGLPDDFWGHCVLHSSYLINRLPTDVLNGSTPFQILFGKDVDYEHFRSVGCLAFAATISPGRNKMGSKASKDVKFYEHVYPFRDKNLDVNKPASELFNPTLPLVPISVEADASSLEPTRGHVIPAATSQSCDNNSDEITSRALLNDDDIHSG